MDIFLSSAPFCISPPPHCKNPRAVAINFNSQQLKLILLNNDFPTQGRGEDGRPCIHPLSRCDKQWLPRALPWFHFFLQWLCVWHLGSLLPVKIPALSTVLELPANSSVHYRPLLLEQRKKTMKMPLWGVSASHLEELAPQLPVWGFCKFKFDNIACLLAIHSNYKAVTSEENSKRETPSAGGELFDLNQKRPVS